MGIISTELTRIRHDELASAYSSPERGYFHSYKTHLKAAEVLLTEQDCHREAYMALLVSIECYLKDIFCTLRYKTIGNYNKTVQSGLKFFPPAIHRRWTQALTATNFGHDLYELAQCIKEFCSNLQDNSAYTTFLAELPREKDWINARYGAYFEENYSKKIDVLNDAFAKVRQEAFGEYK